MKRLLSKKIFFIILLICTNYISEAQNKNELYFNAIGGGFNYSGPASSNSNTAIFDASTVPNYYSESPFGKKLSFSFALEVNTTKVLKNNFLFGAGFGFQQYNSKTKYDSLATYRVIPLIYSATGDVNLKNSYINLRPFIGKRVGTANQFFDFELGTDLAFCLSSKEFGSITGNTGNTVNYEFQRKKPAIDIRPNIGIKMQYEKVGILFRYSKGLSNYKNANGKSAHSNFIGLGLSFAMHKK